MPHTLLKHQIEPSELLLLAIKERRSVVVSAPAGTGKTYPVVNALRRAQELGYLPLETPKLASICYVAPNAGRIQQHRVVAIEGVKNTTVTSYSALRSTFGSLFIDWVPKKITRDGSDLLYDPIWNADEIPDAMAADECQAVKNSSSQQGEIILNYAKQGGLIIFISYTPFQKVIEAKVICIACGLCTESTWLEYAYGVAGNAELTANSPAATKRIKDDLVRIGAWITFKNVHWKKKARIKTRLINFASAQDATIYQLAYEEYKQKLAELGRQGPSGIAEIFVALLKFWQCAELLKSPQLATYGRLIQERENKQVIIAANFVESLRSIWSNLVKQGVAKEQIGWLVGGQTEKQRQGFIDKFQRGELNYLLITLKTGGTSLSLHHELEIARPRHVILPLTWSVFDMAQVLGRAHRINSLSDTTQDIIGYASTIEGQRILPRLDVKLKCLRELLEKKDSYILDILNEGAAQDDNAINAALLDKISTNDKESNDEDIMDTDMLEIEDTIEEQKLLTL